MSFLAPLYALAALAMVGPIVLHLVRKRPTEVVEFSSLMFLDAATPKLTSRSRIEQWLLLLCRAGFVGLLAFAFARPYWNTTGGSLGGSELGVRRLLLIDTSASMQREGVWDGVRDAAEKWLEAVKPADALSVYTFAEEIVPQLSIQQALRVSVGSRQAAARAAIASIEPGWGRGQLGSAIAGALDALQMEHTEGEESGRLEIDVVTDLAVGNGLDGLVGIDWPSNARLRVLPVRAAAAGNAYAMVMPNRWDGTQDDAKQRGNAIATLGNADDEGNPMAMDGDAKWWRVRVTHELANDSRSDRVGDVAETASSPTDTFELQWLDQKRMPVSGTRVTCRVPRGLSAVVKIKPPTADSQTLELRGDGCEFDNLRFVAPNPPRKWTIACIETQDQPPESSLTFFLERVPFGDTDSVVGVERWGPGVLREQVKSKGVNWVIASHALTQEDAAWLESYMRAGGHFLWVWDQPADEKDASGMSWGARYMQRVRDWTGDEAIRVEEAVVDQYSLMTRVDLKSSLFAAFADAKFNDFSKIRFWKHRKWTGLEGGGWTVVASYDSGAPTILSKQLGKGRLTILTAGWQPIESQLALSSKFVPMMSQLFAEAKPRTQDLQLESGTYLDGGMLEGDRQQVGLDEGGLQSLISPKGESIARDADRGGWPLNAPGMYQAILHDGSRQPVAVNVPASESKTSMMDLDAFSRYGISAEAGVERAVSSEESRHLIAGELEAQQSGWWWLLALALVVIAMESILCLRGSKWNPRPVAAT
jgi:hypothetical protein